MHKKKMSMLFIVLASAITLIVIRNIALSTDEWPRRMNSEKLVELLRSNDVDERTAALEYTLDAVKKKEIALQGELRKTCDEVIMEFIENRVTIDTRKDEEGHYPGAIMKLAAEINDEKYLPYFLKCINSNDAIKAIVKQGDKAINELLKVAEDPLKTEGQKWDIAMALNAVIILQKHGEYITPDVRTKIKKQAIKMLANANEESETNTAMINNKEKSRMEKRALIRKSILDLFGNLGDKDLIPIVEKISKEDSYTSEISEKSLQMLRMSDEERKTYWLKTRKEAATNRGNKKKVKVYEVREEALKILKQLKNQE